MFRKMLFAALCVLPTAAHAEWVEASSAHFRVFSNDRPERVKEFATHLEQFDKALRVRFGMGDPDVGKAARVTVYVVSSTEQVARLARNKMAAGFYSGRAGAAIAFVPRNSGTGETTDLSSEAILLHEYTHHFMHTAFADAAFPAWFVEGFAETYATAKFERDGSIILGNPPQYRAYGLLNETMSAERLLTATPSELREDDGDVFYGRGWLLTHYLTFSGQRPTQFATYIRAINRGAAPLAAAQEAFGDLKALNSELNRYVTKRFGALRVAATALTIKPVEIRTLPAGEAAMMPIRIRSQAGVDDKTAPDIYKDALKIAGAWPNDPAVQDALAEAAFDAKDYAAAEAAADRAIAADPKLLRAWLYKADAQIRRALAAKDQKPETWTAIRRVINRANRIDPEDPRPLLRFYFSFMQQEIAPNANAREALLYASTLAPQDDGLRMTAGAIYLEEGKLEEAKRAIAAVAYNPHGGEMAAAAAAMLAMIEKGDAAGAKAISKGTPASEETTPPMLRQAIPGVTARLAAAGAWR